MIAVVLALAVVSGSPDAVVDSRTAEGARTVETEWRYKDVRIVETDFRGPDANGRPNGAPNRAYDITPHAGGRTFDDSLWEVIDPATLEGRRTDGRLSFNWYRLNIRIPDRIGGFDPTGSTVVFETIVDDYAEVWVDGELPRTLGQIGGSLVAGWNAPNRLVITTNARTGQRIQLAVFGANGPLSDPPPNYIWIRSARLEFQGGDIAEYKQPGSNGLAIDPEGRLTINQHGNRRVVRAERDGSLTVLADRYEGRRLNSPNDLVYKSDGALYFTDPPFGLPKVYDDARKELPYSGVFRVANGRLQLLTTDLKGPNGLAFSPDEKYLYVDNWDEKAKTVSRYEVQPDGTLASGTVFFDMTPAPGDEALDGLKVDRDGNLFVSGPGGLWIIAGGTSTLPSSFSLLTSERLFSTGAGIPAPAPPL